MPQGFLSLNIENGISIMFMMLLLYLIAALLYQIVLHGFSGGGGGAEPSISFGTNFNLTA